VVFCFGLLASVRATAGGHGEARGFRRLVRAAGRGHPNGVGLHVTYTAANPFTRTKPTICKRCTRVGLEPGLHRLFFLSTPPPVKYNPQKNKASNTKDPPGSLKHIFFCWFIQLGQHFALYEKLVPFLDFEPLVFGKSLFI